MSEQAVNCLEYNSQRSPLKIPEYGRHLHKLIANVQHMPDKEQRNKAACAVIRIMGTMNPHLRDVPDFQHMLWDQLFQMSEFNIDVDSPYPIPTQESVHIPQVNLAYPQKNPKYRFYGNNILAMIEQVISWEASEKKDALVVVIANHMKKCYLSWNKESVTDEVIFEHLLELSHGKINLLKKDEELSTTSDLIRVNKKQSNKFSTANLSNGQSNQGYKNKRFTKNFSSNNTNTKNYTTGYKKGN